MPHDSARTARPGVPIGPSQALDSPNTAPEPAARAPRRWTTALGMGGLIPFLAFAVAAVALGDDRASIAVVAQIQYAASILSFVGALHWGIALAVPAMSAARARVALAWSVLPALYAWAAVVVPDLMPEFDAAHTTLALLAAGFVVVWLVDLVLYRGHPVPAWFPRLRTTLTMGATLSLLVTLLA